MKTYNSRIFIIVAAAIFSLIAQGAMAQATLAPIRYNSQLEDNYSKVMNRRSMAAFTDTIPVSLPFFDDFTGYKYRNNTSPDTSNWVQGGGTFVNNTFPVLPPSYNVATFDAIKEDGTPYNFNSAQINGPTDSLKSRPISLENLDPFLASTVYLSFYWQAGGKYSQMAPDFEDDSLTLEFKAPDGNWRSVWSVNNQTNKSFNPEIIHVSPEFHGPLFQFRFVKYGLMNGNNIWHVDYVYLNSGRNEGDTLFANREEFAISQKPGYFLKEYTAMPNTHFRASPAGTTLDSVNTFVNLLGASETPFRYKARLTEKISNTLIKEYSNIPFPDINTPSNFDSQLRYTIPVEEQLIKGNAQNPSEMELSFYIDSIVHPAGDFRYYNDTAATVVSLKDYYAYDDGSAELVYFVNGNFGQTAVKFQTLIPDTLNYLKIHFSKYLNNIDGQPFTIYVWKELRGIDNQVKDSVLASINANVTYTDRVNGFTEIKLPSLPIEGTYYIGWQQNRGGSESITVGFDINTAPQSNIYQNYAGSWQPFNLAAGSLMIQPVFRKASLVNSDINQGISKAGIYPNPASDNVTITGDIKEMFLYDLSGKLLISQQFDTNTERQLDISKLRPGMYFIQLIDNKNKKTAQKLIVSDK